MSKTESPAPIEESSLPEFNIDRPSTMSDAKDLILGVGNKAGEVLGVLSHTLAHMQKQNLQLQEVVDQAKTTNKFASQTNMRVVIMLGLLVFAFGTSLLQAFRMHQTVKQLEGTEVSLLEVKKELQQSLVLATEINKKATDTTQSVAKIEERVQDSPKLVADNKTGELKLEVPISKHQVNIARTRATPKLQPTAASPASPPVPLDPQANESPKAVIPIPGSSNLVF